MDRNGKFITGLNGLGEAYDGQDEAEIELAFQVQRGEPGDLSLLTALVERYAADVSRLASALLTQPGFPLPVDSDTQTVVLRTFSNAIRHTDRFRGKTSLRNWLLSITIRQIAQYQRESRKRGLLRQSEEEISPAESNPATWESFDDLPEKLRITLILRYLCGLEVDDIKETLGARSKQAHGWLVAGRRMLMLEPPTSHRSDELEEYVDGLLADNLTQRNELESHLPACQTCDAFLVHLRALDQQLREGLQQRWQLPALTSQDFERLAQMVIESLQAQQKWRLSAIPLNQVCLAP